MPTTLVIVRAIIAENLREKFDHWTSTDPLSRALKVFKYGKAWRFWSEVEQPVGWVSAEGA